MSGNFTDSPFTVLSDANDYAVKVHTIFHAHAESLNERQQMAVDKIDQWCKRSQELIEKHADEQRNCLVNYYNHLRHSFNEKYKESLEKANSYYAKRQSDLFGELRDACQNFQIQLVKLTFSKFEIDYPEVTLSKEQWKIEEPIVDTRMSARRRRRYRLDLTQKAENINEVRAATSSSDSVATNLKSTTYVCSLKHCFVFQYFQHFFD